MIRVNFVKPCLQYNSVVYHMKVDYLNFLKISSLTKFSALTEITEAATEGTLSNFFLLMA